MTNSPGPSDTTFQARITKEGIEITGQSFAESPDCPRFLPTKTQIKYVSFSEAIDFLCVDSCSQPKKYKSRMFSKPLTNHSIDLLIAAAEKIQPVNGEFSVEIRQLKGDSETGVPWKGANYWLDIAIHWKDRSPANNYQLGDAQLELLYLQLLPNADNYSYVGSIDSSLTRCEYYGDSFEQLKTIKEK